MGHLEDIGMQVDVRGEHRGLGLPFGVAGQEHTPIADRRHEHDGVVVRVRIRPGPAAVGREDVEPEIAALRGTETARTMDCLDCHNRIGHGIPTINDAVDSAIDQGQISASLPYVKREALDRLDRGLR
mgnify:CR=1 FL=1